MSFIEFDHIRKTYANNTLPAVESLNLGIAKGEFMTFLGPSGSGKTTTLMLLAGFEKPTSGSIRLEGTPIDALPPYERNMGVVFQSYSLFPHMSVAQNIAFPLEMRKVPKPQIQHRVAAALEKVRLGRHADRRPSQLSGGEQQRVALARALVFDPKLVLMDEPLSALDKNLREELQLEIRRLHRELGVTMVFVTHDQSEAMNLSDRVCVFNHGRVEQLDTPQQLYDRPTNVFVAGFIGDNNMLAGDVDRVDASDEYARLTTLNGTICRGRLRTTGTYPQSSMLCIRPERIDVAAANGSLETDNKIDARLIDLIHQGDHWRVIMALKASDGGETRQWMAKVNPSQLPAGLSIGQPIQIGFNTRDAWVI